MPSSTKNEKRTTVRGLGEIAFRVNDLDAMQRFYAEVIGLPSRRSGATRFSAIAASTNGLSSLRYSRNVCPKPEYLKTLGSDKTLRLSS